MKPISEKTICEQASIFYYDYIQDDRVSSIKPEILSHIEKCTLCQNEIQKLEVILTDTTDQTTAEKRRQKNIQSAALLASHFNLVNEKVTCNIAKRFMPSLADSSFDIRVPTPITVHIEKCYLCEHDLNTIREFKLTPNQLTYLERVFASQPKGHPEEYELYKKTIDSSVKMDFNDDTLSVLKQICERKESGIVTEYIPKKQVVLTLSENLCNSYKDWPVEVKVYDSTKETAKARKAQVGYQGLIRQLAKPLVAAAAVILVAVLLFVGTSAQAIKYDAIYDAISKVQNICLMTGSPEFKEKTQKVWISKALNIKLFYSADNWTLWDIQNKVRKTQIAESGYSGMDKLNDSEITNAKQTMDIPVGLLPFQSPSSMPAKYNWKSVPDKEATTQFHNIQIYDLLWSDKTADGSSVYYRWRVYIDNNTMLPKRAENWQKQASIGEYELRSWTDITYPQTPEVEKLIRQLGFVQK
jgi:hypothetical protein